MPTASGAKKRFWIIEDMSPFGKRRKTASSRKMLDEGMMLEGFRRFDLYEDCRDPTCQFSLKVTHYHCTRENCGYKFCGRTHMYKHAQHHDRVDNLVLDDFKRFKASLSCHFADCPFSGSSTHFHCLRCRFRCTDSTKVTAHRKHHGKQDVISAAGFCQFSSSADCAVSRTSLREAAPAPQAGLARGQGTAGGRRRGVRGARWTVGPFRRAGTLGTLWDRACATLAGRSRPTLSGRPDRKQLPGGPQPAREADGDEQPDPAAPESPVPCAPQRVTYGFRKTKAFSPPKDPLGRGQSPPQTWVLHPGPRRHPGNC
uniref:C2H2-type domain-containing protein n=1 Tax=Panthera tigris altaica TaxID=74533 RepID=A0A8C9JWS3_PANTA